MREIKLTDCYKRNSNLLHNIIDDEVVILSIDNEEYYHLNLTASRIWNLLETPLSFDAIVNQLISEYDVEFEDCSIETKQYLIELVELNIIDIIE